MDTTGKALVAHWRWVAEKGIMNKNSADALRVACSHILSTLDNWENVDVNKLDIDDVTKRFENLRARDFKPQTLVAYGKRFRQAVGLFQDYERDPSSWAPNSKSSTKGTRQSKSEAKPQKPVDPVEQNKNDIGETNGLISYPFPLRPDTIVTLQLPKDLTQEEAERLHTFMQALVVK